MKAIFTGDFYSTSEKKYSKPLLNLLKSADNVVINFEAPININNCKVASKVGASLYHNIDVLEQLKILNITDLCLANNHYFDLGEDVAKLSTQLLIKNNYVCHGVNESNRNDFINKIHPDIAIINVAESEFGVALSVGDNVGFKSVTDPTLYHKIVEAKSKYKFLIIVIHAGKENTNSPLPQWKVIYRNFIDLGVSAVIAHHPHVPQHIESYRDGFIYYSLGNFIMDFVSGHRMSKIGILVLMELSGGKLIFSHKYVVHSKEDNTLDLLSESNKEIIDQNLSSMFNREPIININEYFRLDVKRIIFSKIPEFLEFIPYIKERKFRKYDFFLHNSRFESHRYSQELYINTRKKR